MSHISFPLVALTHTHRRGVLALALALPAAGLACDSDAEDMDTAATAATSDTDGATGDSGSPNDDGNDSNDDTTGGDASSDATDDGPSDDTGDETGDGTDDGTDDDSPGDTDDTAGQEGPPRVATMSVYLEHASMLAQAVDAQAELVSISGLGIAGDGTVDLQGDTGFLRRWVFAYQRADGTDFRFDYLPENGLTEDFPLLEDPTGSVVAELPFPASTTLMDSDTLAATFEEQCGAVIAGDELDSLLYVVGSETGDVQYSITLASGASWLVIDNAGVLEPIAPGSDPCI